MFRDRPIFYYNGIFFILKLLVELILDLKQMAPRGTIVTRQDELFAVPCAAVVDILFYL
jgi:hypothetical protein